MKYFVQVKCRDFQMTHKAKNFKFLIVIIFHFGPQFFQNFKIDPNEFPTNCKLTPQFFKNYNLALNFFNL